MPELIYPTSTKILGPILIDTASLMELDRILGEQMQSLRDLRNRMVGNWFWFFCIGDPRLLDPQLSAETCGGFGNR